MDPAGGATAAASGTAAAPSEIGKVPAAASNAAASAGGDARGSDNNVVCWFYKYRAYKRGVGYKYMHPTT